MMLQTLLYHGRVLYGAGDVLRMPHNYQAYRCVARDGFRCMIPHGIGAAGVEPPVSADPCRRIGMELSAGGGGAVLLLCMRRCLLKVTPGVAL